MLPPGVWFRKGGFNLGDRFEFADSMGKQHSLEIGPQRRTKSGDAVTYMTIDHHPEPILTELDQEPGREKRKAALSAKEIEALAKTGDIRSPLKGTVSEVPLDKGNEVSAGQVLIVLEAMKMLNNVLSEISGTVSEVLVSPGDAVEVGDPLIMVRKAGDAAARA